MSYIPIPHHLLGFPGGARGKEPACQFRRHKTWVPSLGQEDPLEKEMATHSRLLALPGELHGQRSPVGYSHGVTESDMTERLQHVLYINQNRISRTENKPKKINTL